jgi:predicted RNA-binding Zn ribbon-like protein
MIGPSAAAELRTAVEARPAEANRVLDEARELRETLHAVFSAVAQGRQPLPPVLAALATHMGAAFARARLVVHDGALVWAPAPISALPDITRELARVAARLVGSSQLGRVRACAAEDCRWWFVDETKNHSRRWCEMKTCGNRAKLRRFRTRQ